MYEAKDGGFLFGNAFNAVVQAFNGTHVVDGCTVSIDSGLTGQQDTLVIESGSVRIDGTKHGVDSQNVQINAADEGPRYDSISVDSTGTVQVTEGTPDTTSNPRPAAPSVPEGHVLLALQRVSVDAVQVADTELYDTRIIHEQFTESDALAAVNTDEDHGTTASHEYTHSETISGSDITEYSTSHGDNQSTVANVSGSGVVTGGIIASQNSYTATVEVDGGNYTLSGTSAKLSGQSGQNITCVPPTRFDSSYKLSVDTSYCGGTVWIKE